MPGVVYINNARQRQARATGAFALPVAPINSHGAPRRNCRKSASSMLYNMYRKSAWLAGNLDLLASYLSSESV